MTGRQLGCFRLGRELGSGGMGKVHAATVVGRCPGLDEGARVALKIVHPHLLDQAGFFRRFLREAEIGVSVEHPNVVRTYLADALGSEHFLVMEYVEGQTLRELLAELDRVPEELCRHIGREVAKGLCAIHDAGVVHRDLKPENVLITADQDVKVMDLGVARLQEETVRLSQTGAFVGSIHYAAPEQFGSGKSSDHRVDLHALGVLLYELASGIHPYYDADARAAIARVMNDKPRRIHEIHPQLSAFFEEVVHTLLAKDPDERFATADELHSVLEQGEDGAWWEERSRALRMQTRRPLRRVRIPRETALYGRDDDLARLRALYDEAAAGEGRVVLIEGEAGIGKSRLVDEFVGRLVQDGEDVSFLFGSYPPSGAATAAGAWSTAFREQFGAEGCAPYLTHTPLLAPAFDAVLRGDVAPADAVPLSRESLGTCFVHATRALAAERTTIMLIDDLHFAPEDARGLFTAVALAAPGHRVLLVGTMRPGVPQEWVANLARQEHCDHLTLARLGAKDLALLLKDSFRSERLAQELGLQIAVKSDGNPFFAFEIVRGLREGQFITQQDDGTWARTQVIEGIRIPSSVMDLIQARISDLDEDDRNLLDVASCCGFEFDPLLVGVVLDLGQIPVMRRLARIEKTHRLVRSAGRRYVFDHHQVQEALYEGLPVLLKEPYHAALAEALEARAGAAEKDPADLPGDLAVELCEHFFEGGRGEQAMRYHAAALEHLVAGYLNDQTITLIDRALAVPDLVVGAERVGLLLRLASGCLSIGYPERAGNALAQARALAEADGSSILLSRVGLAQAQHADHIGRHAEAVSHATQALADARKARDPGQASLAANHTSFSLLLLGRTAEARSTSEQAAALAHEAGDDRLRAHAAHGLANVLTQTGRPAEAEPHLERFLAITVERGDRGGEAVGEMAIGNNHHVLGRAAEAMTHHRRARDLAREIGARTIESRACGNLSLVHRALGQFAEALELSERHLAIAHETGDRRAQAGGASFVSSAQFSLGRLGESLEHAISARSIAAETGEVGRAASCDQQLGWLFMRLGSLTCAREAFVAARKATDDPSQPAASAWIDVALGDVAHWSGQLDEATEMHVTALESLRDAGRHEGTAGILADLAEIAAERGARDEAATHVDEAVTLAVKHDEPLWLVRALTLRASLCSGVPKSALDAFAEHGERLPHFGRLDVLHHLWRATGDDAHLSEAKRLLDYAVEHAPEEYRESMIANVPTHRAVAAAAGDGAPTP